jgi:hypothetical protein
MGFANFVADSHIIRLKQPAYNEIFLVFPARINLRCGRRTAFSSARISHLPSWSQQHLARLSAHFAVFLVFPAYVTSLSELKW